MVRGQQPLLRSRAASSLTAPSMAAEKSNSSSFLIFGKQPKRGSPNHSPCHATSSAHAEPVLGFSQAKQHKQWPLPADWPLPHRPDGCSAAVPPKKKTRRIKFFLHRCGTREDKEINGRRFFARAR